MERIFGTPNIDRYSKKELFEESCQIIQNFLGTDIEAERIDDEKYDRLIRLFEIARFGRDKYPYLLLFKFNQNQLSEVEIWDDSHFNEEIENSTAFTGMIYSIPSLTEISKNQKLLFNVFKELLDPENTPTNKSFLTNTVCMAGSSDCILLLGWANKNYFSDPKDKKLTLDL